jgi:hypothetical protein
VSERHKAKKSTAKELIPPLIIGVLGALGVVALYFTVPGFQAVEVLGLLLGVVFVALGFKQRILRGIMALFILYFATGIAATFYELTSPYIGAPFGGEPTLSNKTLAFIVLTIVIWVALEVLGRALFKDSTLPALGILDNLGGLFLYLIIGILVATLLFNAVGYGWARRAHNRAALRTRFRQVLQIHYATQSFWFPGSPPSIYGYDLNPPSEP